MVVWGLQEDVDNDDGSRYYHTYDNFFVYGGRGLKSDFGEYCVDDTDTPGHVAWIDLSSLGSVHTHLPLNLIWVAFDTN